MKKKALLSLIVIGLSACAPISAPFVPPVGALASVQAPLDLEAGHTENGTKKGSSSIHTILGLFSFGDASYAAAAKNGGISVIKSSDYSYFNLFFLYQQTTVNVYGD